MDDLTLNVQPGDTGLQVKALVSCFLHDKEQYIKVKVYFCRNIVIHGRIP